MTIALRKALCAKSAINVVLAASAIGIGCGFWDFGREVFNTARVATSTAMPQGKASAFLTGYLDSLDNYAHCIMMRPFLTAAIANNSNELGVRGILPLIRFVPNLAAASVASLGGVSSAYFQPIKAEGTVPLEPQVATKSREYPRYICQ